METLPADNPASVVLDFINEAGNEYQSSKLRRLRAAERGRAAGLTYEQIGTQLGTTGAAVRQMLKRANGGQ